MLFQDIWKILSTGEFLSYLFEGFWHTLVITVVAALLGLVLGTVVAIVKIAAPQYKWLKIPSAICSVYTTVFRGTPVALQLFIMVFAIFAIPGFKVYAAILTFGINSGAYVSENIRAGIQSVEKGQLEAGRAMGLGWVKTMIHIILPQAVKNVIPAIGNEMIALLKETAIISWVGSTPGMLTFDLNAAADVINKSVVNYLASGILVGICYLIIVYAMVWGVKLIERRLRASDNR